MRHSGLGRLAGIALPLALTGCVASTGATTPGPSRGVKLSIHNGTTITVALVVDGSVIETVPPGARESPIKGNLPALPWKVETRSPSGRVLSTMTVNGGDARQATLANGGVESQGDSARADLSCGRLDVWAGEVEPLGPIFSPGPSGDCA